MGNLDSSDRNSQLYSVLKPLKWQKQAWLGESQLVRDRETGLRGQLYSLNLDNKQSQIRIYQFRKDNPKHIVTIHSIQQQNYQILCTGSSGIKVVTQRIPFRLTDLGHIGYAQGLYILQCALKGASLIDNRYLSTLKNSQQNTKKRYIHYTDQMICFTQKGQTKIWVNQHIALNTPQFRQYKQSNPISQTFKKKKSSQLPNANILDPLNIQKLQTKQLMHLIQQKMSVKQTQLHDLVNFQNCIDFILRMRAIQQGQSQVVRNVILPSMLFQNITTPLYQKIPNKSKNPSQQSIKKQPQQCCYGSQQYYNTITQRINRNKQLAQRSIIPNRRDNIINHQQRNFGPSPNLQNSSSSQSSSTQDLNKYALPPKPPKTPRTPRKSSKSLTKQRTSSKDLLTTKPNIINTNIAQIQKLPTIQKDIQQIKTNKEPTNQINTFKKQDKVQIPKIAKDYQLTQVKDQNTYQLPEYNKIDRPVSPTLIHYIQPQNHIQTNTILLNPRTTISSDNTPIYRNYINKQRPSFLNKNTYTYINPIQNQQTQNLNNNQIVTVIKLPPNELITKQKQQSPSIIQYKQTSPIKPYFNKNKNRVSSPTPNDSISSYKQQIKSNVKKNQHHPSLWQHGKNNQSPYQQKKLNTSPIQQNTNTKPTQISSQSYHTTNTNTNLTPRKSLTSDSPLNTNTSTSNNLTSITPSNLTKKQSQNNTTTTKPKITFNTKVNNNISYKRANSFNNDINFINTLQSNPLTNQDKNKLIPPISDNNILPSTPNYKKKLPLNYHSNPKNTNTNDNQYQNTLTTHSINTITATDNQYQIKPLTPTTHKATTINTNLLYSPNVQNDNTTKNKANTAIKKNPLPATTTNQSTTSLTTNLNTKLTTVGQLHNKYNLKYNINPSTYNNSSNPQTFSRSSLQNKYNSYLSSFPSANIPKTNIIFNHNFNSNNPTNPTDNYPYTNQPQHHTYTTSYDSNQPLTLSTANNYNQNNYKYTYLKQSPQPSFEDNSNNNTIEQNRNTNSQRYQPRQQQNYLTKYNIQQRMSNILKKQPHNNNTIYNTYTNNIDSSINSNDNNNNLNTSAAKDNPDNNPHNYYQNIANCNQSKSSYQSLYTNSQYN